jgi:hypothetical protein
LRFKGALALFAASLLLGGVYFLYLLPEKKEAERKRELRERIFTVPPGDVDYIMLVNQGQEYELRKGTDAWMVTKPRKLYADMKIIKNMLDVLNKEKILKVVATDTDRLGEFGLMNPVIYAAFGHGGEMEEFFIGRPTPAKSGAYMYKRGLGGIFLVSLEVAGALNQGLYGLRKKEPFVFDASALNRVVIERKGGRIEMARTGSGWFMEYPYRGRCSRKAVSALVNYIGTARGDEYFDGKVPDPSDYGASARIRMFFDNKPGTVMDVYFWGTEFDRGIVLYQHGFDYFARTDQRDFWRAVNDDAGSFRYRNLFEAEPGGVREVAVKWEGKSLALKRDGGGWSSNGRRVSKERLNAFFDALNSLEAYGIVGEDGFIGGEKSFSLVMKNKDNAVTAGLHVYGESGGSTASFDSERGELKTLYAESSNLEEKVLVTNFMVEDMLEMVKKLTEEAPQ